MGSFDTEMGQESPHGGLPFDNRHLDSLLNDAGIDVCLITSKHNIRYLLGGYQFFFFEHFDALGISRYLPILLYAKGRPEDVVYIGNAMEDSEAKLGRFWCPTVETQSWGTLDAMKLAIEHVRRLGLSNAKLGIEPAFLPTDASDLLRSAFDPSHIVDAHFPLERLRAVKTPKELQIVALVTEGAKNRDIAHQLGTKEQVVKNYLRSIYDKTGVSDRLELTVYTVHHRALAEATERARAGMNRVAQAV